MSFEVLFTRTAAGQVEKIDRWWRANRDAAPDLFLEELDTHLALLSSTPSAGAEYAGAGLSGLRRRLLPKTRYHVYYTVEESQRIVLVRAVWHAMRGSGPVL